MTTLRIFISSPGDVAEERAKARQVIEQLQRQNGSGLELIPVLWEDLPLQADSSFQEGIDMMLSKEHGIDIAVFILWSRLGSPLGSAVRKADGSPYLSGTEREFDMMLAARNQSGGERPRILAYMRQDLEGFHQKLKDKDTAHIEELLNQRKLAEGFVREHFHDEQGHNIRAYHTFPEPVNFASRLRVHLKALVDEALGQTSSRRVWEKPPYQGLETFDVEHAAIFHGRDAEECELSLLLRQRAGQEGCAFVVVVGASGSGKSSLVRAGLAASLLNENLDDSVRCWRLAVTTPGAAGLDPLENLARALLDPLALPELGSSSLADLTESLREAPKQALNLAIAPALARAAQKEGGPVRLLLVLDQWEELFTVKPIGEAGRDRFLQAIELLAASGQVSVVATLRSDFFPQAQQDEAFLRLKGRTGQFDLLPPRTASLQKIIREPARLAGLRFEADPATGATLDELILEDAAALADALPLVEYALRELYEQRTAEGLLTFAAYRAMGGVQGAIGNRAEAVFARLTPEIQAVFPDVVQSLVTVEGDAAVRRRAELAVLTGTPACKALVETLIAERFLTADQQGERATVAIAHEALLRSWQRLRALIESNREMLRLRARVEQAHARWIEEGKNPAFLLAKGKPLSDAESLLARHRASLPDEIVPYIEISTRRVREEDRRRLRLFQIVAGVFAVLAIAAGWASWQALRANAKQREMLKQASEQDYNVAHRLIKEGDPNLALNYLARSVRYDPKNELARIALGQVLFFNQNFPFKLAAAPMRHEREVSSAAFSPDRKFLVTASWDGSARAWEAATGKPIGESLRHEQIVWSAAFSPDGRFVVTASRDGTAQVWEAATGKPIGESLRHEKDVSSAAFSPDGRFVVTTSADGTAQVWEAATGKPTGEPMRHEKSVRSAAFSPDGRFVVTASWDGSARAWEAATGKPIGEPMRHEQAVRSAAISPDGRFVVTASEDNTARVWEAATGKPTGEPLRHEKSVSSAGFSPDGRFVVTASKDETARIWEAATGKPSGEPLRHEEEVNSAAFSPDGRFVVTASGDNTARIWEATTGKPIGEPLRHEEEVNSAAFSPDGRFVVTASGDNTARIWEATTGKPIGEPLRHEEEVNSAAFSPDGRFAVTASDDWTAQVWEAATGKPIGEPLRHEREVDSAGFSPDGRFLVTASWDRTARVWEAATGKPTGEPLRHEKSVSSAGFSPDGRFVVTASKDETARIWEATTGKPIGEPLRHEREVNSAGFSPDGRFVVTGSRDGTAHVWEAATGKPTGEPMRHEQAVSSAAFSPDGRFVVTASGDGTAHLWDAATGKPIGEPMRHEESVSSAAFSPDGRFVVTASRDGSAQVWPWFKPLGDSPETIVASIEQITYRKIASDGGPEWIRPETALSCNQLVESFDWFAEPTRTRTIWPGALQTLPQFIVSEIQDVRRFAWRFREARERAKRILDNVDLSNTYMRSFALGRKRAKRILDNAYSVDPAHPLIHLALAMVEDNEQTAAFLRDYDLKRLPESCGYTKDLDPKEVLKLAAEMCAEQGDEERAQMARNKLKALEAP